MTTTVATDLAGRWRRARRAALSRAVLDAARTATAGTLDAAAVAALDPAAVAALDDDALARAALERAPEAALRGVYDASHRLGASFRAYFHLDLPLADLEHLLPALGAACTERAWQRVDDEPARRGSRPPCAATTLHPRACALWREATAGLVHGLSSAVRFARHASGGAGDASCVDVLHVHPESPSRFGPLPAALRAGLEQIRRTARAFDPTLELDFLGVSEGTLYYRAHRSGAAGAEHASTSFEPAIRRRFPDLALCEVSPRPVIATS